MGVRYHFHQMMSSCSMVLAGGMGYTWKDNRELHLNIVHVRIQRGGQGVQTPPPLKSHKNIGFLSNTGPDPLKITKLPSQHSMLGHHRHTSETPFRWRFTGGPIMARLYWYLDPLSPHQLKKKTPSKLDPPYKNFLEPNMHTVLNP